MQESMSMDFPNGLGSLAPCKVTQFFSLYSVRLEEVMIPYSSQFSVAFWKCITYLVYGVSV